MTIKITPLTGLLGAEILGADLKNLEHFDTIRNAFVDHSVIVVRGQSITPDDQLAFAGRFGEINVNRFFKALDTHPEIAVVLKEADQKAAIGEYWHTDHAYDEEPALGSVLRAIDLPPYGGDTVFCSMASAYDELSDRFKDMLNGLHAWHSSRHVFGVQQANSEA